MLNSCFGLEEKPYSEITEDTFIPEDKDVAALLATAYTPLRFIFGWQGFFDLQEEPGDVIITPTRPNGWDDGGTYRQMHQHTWTSESWQPENTYLNAFSGINNANRVKDQIEAGSLPVGDKKEETIAELRAIRALWYSILLDTHANVPLVTAFTDKIPTQSNRKELFDFIVKELKEVIPSLTDKKDATTYGRMNRWAAEALLLRVYMNAEVYVGQKMWNEALAQADILINSGKFQLSSNYSDNFSVNTDYTNPETIFAIPYDGSYAGFGQCHKWYPAIAKEVFDSPKGYYWDGSCANPQFINSYEEGDNRLKDTWLMGPQYGVKDPTVVKWTCINYLPSLTCQKDGKNYTSSDYGYRVAKYEINLQAKTGEWSNDFPYFRYAEVLLSKAECLLRLGKDESIAEDLVFQVRSRSFTDKSKARKPLSVLKGDTRIKYGTLDWDNNIDNHGDQTPVFLGGLYDEWGVEFACEAQRRTQMIRFGTYSTKSWFNHTPTTDGHTSIFPIPYSEIQANNNLKQNPGY